MTRHLRPRIPSLSGERAWPVRLMNRTPRFKWKARIKCRRRYVYVRDHDDRITMRRPICRIFRRHAPVYRSSKAA
ncbi:MAG TPA: hypothetical protein VLV87_08320 [Gammaproteobacteria bacterium]|nr:hypothetical protein [Gammaproteobacteria bacterium]